MTERFDVVVVGSGAGGGVVAGELADRGRQRAPARARSAQDRGRLHALGGEGDARPLVADPVRADRRRRRRCGRTARRALCRRQHHDQHQGRAARPREGLRQVARGERARRPCRRAVRRVRPRAALRPGREAARRARADRLAEERAHGRARLPRARLAARAGALVHRRELHELWLVPPGLSDERRQVDAQHVHPRRLGGGPARAARRRARRAGRDRGRRGDGRRVRRPRRHARAASTRARSSSPPGR